MLVYLTENTVNLNAEDKLSHADCDGNPLKQKTL